MKRSRRATGIGLVALFILGAFANLGWAQSMQVTDETNDFLILSDAFVARPLGAIATVIGAGAWLLALPITIPTESVQRSAELFMHEPFIFTFYREFPDPQY